MLDEGEEVFLFFLTSVALETWRSRTRLIINHSSLLIINLSNSNNINNINNDIANDNKTKQNKKKRTTLWEESTLKENRSVTPERSDKIYTKHMKLTRDYISTVHSFIEIDELTTEGEIQYALCKLHFIVHVSTLYFFFLRFCCRFTGKVEMGLFDT